MALGDYEVRTDAHGDRYVSGTCAECGWLVMESDAHVIRYSKTGERGGIFHPLCAPTGPQWFGVEGE